jgi:hypothetical protein
MRATSALAADSPVNPKIAATTEMTRNMSAHLINDIDWSFCINNGDAEPLFLCEDDRKNTWRHRPQQPEGACGTCCVPPELLCVNKAVPMQRQSVDTMPQPKGPRPRDPLHDPPPQPLKDPPDQPVHDPEGDPSREPQQPFGDPTPSPGSDPPSQQPLNGL